MSTIAKFFSVTVSATPRQFLAAAAAGGAVAAAEALRAYDAGASLRVAVGHGNNYAEEWDADTSASAGSYPACQQFTYEGGTLVWGTCRGAVVAWHPSTEVLEIGVDEPRDFPSYRAEAAGIEAAFILDAEAQCACLGILTETKMYAQRRVPGVVTAYWTPEGVATVHALNEEDAQRVARVGQCVGGGTPEGVIVEYKFVTVIGDDKIAQTRRSLACRLAQR